MCIRDRAAAEAPGVAGNSHFGSGAASADVHEVDKHEGNGTDAGHFGLDVVDANGAASDSLRGPGTWWATLVAKTSTHGAEQADTGGTHAAGAGAVDAQAAGWWSGV
eukprot:3643412-Prorocentrum_lima.AAC.1